MGKIVRRLLIFLFGIPLIAAIVLLLPHRGHFALNLLVIVFSALGAAELAVMLEKKDMRISCVEAVLLGALFPALKTLTISFNCPEWIIPAGLAAASFWILIFPVFFSSKEELYINRAAAGFLALIYPGAFLACICGMGGWNSFHILFFLLIVMGGDSSAWAAGMLFGKGNRGIIKVSPNKSVAGFIGEMCVSMIIGAAAVLLMPDIFVARWGHALVMGVLLGLLTGIAAALGDLCESAIKRGAGCKDSGGLIPGRGGVLDSVDSIALAAPVFYFTWLLLFVHS